VHPSVDMAFWTERRICWGLVDCSLLDSLWERKRLSLRPLLVVGGRVVVVPARVLACASPARRMTSNRSKTSTVVSVSSRLRLSNPAKPAVRYRWSDLAISALDPYCVAKSK